MGAVTETPGREGGRRNRNTGEGGRVGAVTETPGREGGWAP